MISMSFAFPTGLARPLVFVLCAAAVSAPVSAQNEPALFEVVPFDVPALLDASIDLTDFNLDGILDYALTGIDAAGRSATSVYFRTGMGDLHRLSMLVTPVRRGAVRWADYDGDGDPDLTVVGLVAAGDSVGGGVQGEEQGVLHFYENRTIDAQDPRWMLARDPSVELPGVADAALDWGDFDGDGDLDLVLSGYTGTEQATRIYRNDPAPSGRRTFTDIQAGLEGFASGALAWGDVDGDGDPDLVAWGNAGGMLAGRLYRNDAGTFVEAQRLPGLLKGRADWGDYDGDGDLDLLASGAVLDPGLLRGVTTVYRNEEGRLVRQEAGLPGTLGTAAWGDFDGDGDLDVLVEGREDLVAPTFLTVYENRDGVFLRRAILSGLERQAVAWMPGPRPNVLAMGHDGEGQFVTYLFVNQSP